VKTFFFENTLYIWKYFVLNIRQIHHAPLPPKKLLFYGYELYNKLNVVQTTLLATETKKVKNKKHQSGAINLLIV